MASADVPHVNQQVENQETGSLVVAPKERIHMNSQPCNKNRAGFGIQSVAGIPRHLSRPLHHCLAEDSHFPKLCCRRVAGYCYSPRVHRGFTSRLDGFCATLARKCSFRTLLLIYICLNEVLRYTSEGGTVTVTAAISEAILVLLLLVELVYDSISLGLWRGSARFFRSRRCVYNFVVVLAALASGALDFFARKNPPWYNAPFALAGALGRCIRLFRVYQSPSFQVVHSILKKSSFSLLALGGLCFLFALFYTILFFHSYGYTQFNLCYKELSGTDTSLTKCHSDVDQQKQLSPNSGGSVACDGSVTTTSLRDCPDDAHKQEFLWRRFRSHSTTPHAAPTNFSGATKEMVCDASSAFWEFDTTQQYLCSAGRACHAGTTCRNVFYGPWTSTCSEAERLRLYRAGWDLVFQNPVADWGTTGFHSGLSGLTSLLECMTLEGWSAMMYRQADGDSVTRGVLSFILILSVVILGNLLLMNLVVAVVWENTILKSTTPKRVDAREEDLQLFEILGMKWVRHLVQQLSRHDILSSEEKMVAYQLAKKEAHCNEAKIRCTRAVSVRGTVGADMCSAAQPADSQAADLARSLVRSSAVSSGPVSWVCSSAPGGASAASLCTSCAAIGGTQSSSSSIVCGFPRGAAPWMSLPKAASSSKTCLHYSEYAGSSLSAASVTAHSFLTPDTPAPLPSPVNCVFSRLRSYWSRFCNCVFCAVSRKKYVALMFCTASVDLCCIVACTRTDRELVKLTVDCVFTSIYTIDICLQLIGFGWRQFIRDGFKVYDLTVVSVEVVGLAFHFTCCGKTVSSCLAKRIYPASPFLLNAYIFFRSFHALRIFKLIRNFAALRILVELMHDLLRNIFFIYALVVFVVFTMSLVGVICFGDSHFEEHASEIGFPTITRFFNFSTIWKAFMLMYGLMTGESWNVVMSEFFAVYVSYNYSPSKEETLLPAHLFLNTAHLGYIITTYVFITVILLCCFIFNVFGGILIGQFVTSRRLVYNRHVFKLINICREVDIEMPSQKAVGSSNLQRMYSLVESKCKGPTARVRALSLFLRPEKIQERFSAASVSPKARRFITRVSSSISKRKRLSVSPSRAANPLATNMKHGRLSTKFHYSANRGGRSKRVQRMWHVTQSKRVLPKFRSGKVRQKVPSMQQRKAPAQNLSLEEEDKITALGGLPPSKVSDTSYKKLWAISHGSKTHSCLFYAVTHEDFGRTCKNTHQETPMCKRVCSFIRTSCLSLAVGLLWVFDAIIRLFFFCRLFLESQLVSLDTERPDFCIAYVHYILEDEYVVEEPDQLGQESSSSIISSAPPQLRSGARTSTSSAISQRRATRELPQFKLGGRIHSFLYTLMISKYCDFFLAGINVISLLCLVVETCLIKNTTAALCFACLECVFAVFFLFEDTLRMFVFGLLAGRAGTSAVHFYLSSISAVVLVCNQIWLLSSSRQPAYAYFWLTPAFRAVKLLRSLRALQLLDTLHMTGVKLVARSLASSIGEMKNLGVLLMLVFCVCGAIITQITQCFAFTNVASSIAGASSSTLSTAGSKSTEEGRTDNLSLLTASLPIKNPKSLKSCGFPNFLEAHSVVSARLSAKISCVPSLPEQPIFTRLPYERLDSSRAAPYSFDSMIESLLGVFVLSTAEGWPLLLAQLLQQQPIQQRTILTVVVFVFVSVVAIFCVNLFVGMIVEASRRKKTRMETQDSLLSPAIHKWIEVQKVLFDAPLQHGDTVPDFDQAGRKRLVWLRKGAAAIVTRSSYHCFDLAQILLFCLVLLFYGPWYDVLMGNVARATNAACGLVAVVLCCCFVVGLMLKLLARGRLFFKDKLDVVDMLICIVIAMRVVCALLFKEQRRHLKGKLVSAFWPMSFRLFRWARFLYRHVYFFRTLFTTISGVAKAFLTALGLLGIALFFFALWGVLLFHDSPVHKYTNKYANFTNLPAAFMAVIGACTGEDWHLMLQQMRLYYAQKKQTTLAYLVVLFFIAFIIMVFFTLMSLFTSTVLEKYMETVRNESLWRISRQHSLLLELWMPDEEGMLFKTLEATLEILWSIDFPIGLKDAVPAVESPEAAYALLAKFELPLYYCNGGKNSTSCDSKRIPTGNGESALYKVHIRDVVLNAARRACKFHAISHGEGVLQEGQVALDPRLIQSWVAKYPEVNRMRCTYDLKHFNAAVSIQTSWRRRHLFVNGHVASPDWCERYIVDSLRTMVASRHQNASGRPRRSSQGEGQRDICRGERDREKKGSTESSCKYETLTTRSLISTEHKKCSRTASKRKSCKTVATVYNGSRQTSCATSRSKSESAAKERQPVERDAPPQKCQSKELEPDSNRFTALKAAAPDEEGQNVPCARRERTSAGAIPRIRQVRPSDVENGRGGTSVAYSSQPRQSRQDLSKNRVEKSSVHGLQHQFSSKAKESTPVTADNERTKPPARGQHPQGLCTSQAICEGLKNEDIIFQHSTSRPLAAYGLDEERMGEPASGRDSQTSTASIFQSSCEMFSKDDASSAKFTSTQSVPKGGDEGQPRSPAQRRRSKKSRSSVSQTKCEGSRNDDALSRRYTPKQPLVHENDGEQWASSGHARRSQRSSASASHTRCKESVIGNAPFRKFRSRQSVRRTDDKEQMGTSALWWNFPNERASASQAGCEASKNVESLARCMSSQQVLYGSDKPQMNPAADRWHRQRSSGFGSQLRCEESKERGATSRPSTPEQPVLYGCYEEPTGPANHKWRSQRRSGFALKLRCEGSEDRVALSRPLTPELSDIYSGDAKHLTARVSEQHSQWKRASTTQARCRKTKEKSDTSLQFTTKKSPVYESEEERMGFLTRKWKPLKSTASTCHVQCEMSETDKTPPRKSASRQSAKYWSDKDGVILRDRVGQQKKCPSFDPQAQCYELMEVAAAPKHSTLRQSVVYKGGKEQMTSAAHLQQPRGRASVSQVNGGDRTSADAAAHTLTPRLPVPYGLKHEQMGPPARGGPLLRRELSAFPVSCGDSENNNSLAFQSRSRDLIVCELGEGATTKRDHRKHSQEREPFASLVKSENWKGKDRTPPTLASRPSVEYGCHAAQKSSHAPVEHLQKRRESGSQIKCEGSGHSHTTSQQSTARKSEIDMIRNTAYFYDGATGVGGDSLGARHRHAGDRRSATRIVQAAPAVRKASSAGIVKVFHEPIVLDCAVDYLPGQIITRSPAGALASPSALIDRDDPPQSKVDRRFSELDSASFASKRRRSADSVDKRRVSGKSMATRLARVSTSYSPP